MNSDQLLRGIPLRLDELVRAIPLAWTDETRGDDAFKGYLPANYRTNMTAGQCIVSSLLIQRHCGGVIIGCKITNIPHYFNELSGGIWVDVTRSQFTGPKTTSSVRDIKRNPAKDLYIFEGTCERVDMLEYRVRDILAEQ